MIRGWTELTRSNAAIRALGLATKASAAAMFGQAISTPNPIMETAMAKKVEGAETAATEKVVDVKGVFRITRHAMFTSLALLGLGNILLRGYAGEARMVQCSAVLCSHPQMGLPSWEQQDVRPSLTTWNCKASMHECKLLKGWQMLDGSGCRCRVQLSASYLRLLHQRLPVALPVDMSFNSLCSGQV